MAQSTSQTPRSSHITTEGDSISDGTHPTDQDRLRYPDLFAVAQDVGYRNEEQHAAALLTISGETHLVQGAPGFLNAPTVPRRLTRAPIHARSLAPTVITTVRSAFPDVNYMEYKGLAHDITELINDREKESRQRLAQQERWIEGLQNHVRELYAHIDSFKRTLQDVSARLDIHGLTTPGSATAPRPLMEPFDSGPPTSPPTSSSTPRAFPQPYA